MADERTEQSDTTPQGSTGSHSDLQSNMVALHRATLSLFSDLTLEGVLRRVLYAARELSRAKYAALGIPDGKGGLETFLTLGLSDEEMKKISHRPVGKGLLGEMIRGGESIRIPEVSEHPKSIGFPENHPPMHSFLGVPISAYGQPLGQIYLTDKRDTQLFTAEDQQLIEMLAAHAAAAIENSRLYTKVLQSEFELSERNQQLALVNTLATTVSSAIELEDTLQLMLEKVMDLFDAVAGEIYLRETELGTFHRGIHVGSPPKTVWSAESFRRDEGVQGEVARTGQLQRVQDLESLGDELQSEVRDAGFSSLVAVPLTSPSGVMGVLTIVFQEDREIDLGEDGLLEAVGAGVGIAVENARLYRQARRVAVLEERERIGMDLHDGVIQSIYAVGLMLDNIRFSMAEDYDEATRLLDEAISGLNETIRDIRTYILDLQPSRIATEDFEEALGRLVSEFRANTLVETELIMDPEALALVENHRSAELFHIAQEALANTAKHAQATRVLVSLRCLDQTSLTFQVIDNGRGFAQDIQPSVLGHGLSNMAERTRGIGGEFEIVSQPDEGTTVTIRIPVRVTEPSAQ